MNKIDVTINLKEIGQETVHELIHEGGILKSVVVTSNGSPSDTTICLVIHNEEHNQTNVVTIQDWTALREATNG